MGASSYVLITAARNEASYIENTLWSVVSQKLRPLKWVIVSDGSGDGTDSIIEKYSAKHSFIQLLKLNRHGDRNFGNKARALNKGIVLLKDINYTHIGNLDADISFQEYYFEYLLAKLDEDKSLGLVGGSIYDYYNNRFHKVIHYLNSVGGPVQLFRKECFKDIGGYVPIDTGGIDFVAGVSARMRGWKVRTFPELKVLHYRRQGTAGHNILFARFRDGSKEYLLGHHFLFQFAKCIRRVTEWPYVASSACRLYGYIYAALFMKSNYCVSDEFIRYLRWEQLQRLKIAFFLDNEQKLNQKKLSRKFEANRLYFK